MTNYYFEVYMRVFKGVSVDFAVFHCDICLKGKLQRDGKGVLWCGGVLTLPSVTTLHNQGQLDD